MFSQIICFCFYIFLNYFCSQKVQIYLKVIIARFLPQNRAAEFRGRAGSVVYVFEWIGLLLNVSDFHIKCT